MQTMDYGAYDSYEFVGGTATDALLVEDESGLLMASGVAGSARPMDVNFDDPRIASMPKILLMGPRRGGKSSIQVCT